MSETTGAEAREWVGWLATVLGGFAGFGAALAALALVIWRHGYRAGVNRERRRQLKQLMKR